MGYRGCYRITSIGIKRFNWHECDSKGISWSRFVVISLLVLDENGVYLTCSILEKNDINGEINVVFIFTHFIFLIINTHTQSVKKGNFTRGRSLSSYHGLEIILVFLD